MHTKLNIRCSSRGVRCDEATLLLPLEREMYIRKESQIIVALALVALVAAAPVEEESPKIILSEYDQQPNGAYRYEFKTEDGISKSEEADVKEVLDADNKPQQVLVVRGQFSYPRLDGGVETISYVADENGYRAEGPSIPQPPAPARR
ncbi:unnamed protein product [Danaus chrysippus]|uniref:(African queen) hypothetical protein n=1 Tax=Danaus chrysippus TaxID=151541 RepID=A0A8J2VZ04_9NEOP|nr:unnamed protein product [Danaus chrysippus]